VRNLAWTLLATFFFVCGCTSETAPSAVAPERATLTNGPSPGVDYVAIVGDSFTVGGSDELGYAKARWPYLVYTRLKEQDILMSGKVDGMGLSGWVNAGPRGDAGTFEKHVVSATGTNDRVVVLFGARGVDEGVPPQQLADAVQRTLARSKERAPAAAILVIGPVWTAWTTQEPSSEMLSIRDVVRAKTEAAGAIFVDAIADRWFADRPDLIGSNGNPDDDGHVYIADQLTPLLTSLLPK
jgi:hypothetical protein